MRSQRTALAVYDCAGVKQSARESLILHTVERAVPPSLQLLIAFAAGVPRDVFYLNYLALLLEEPQSATKCTITKAAGLLPVQEMKMKKESSSSSPTHLSPNPHLNRRPQSKSAARPLV